MPPASGYPERVRDAVGSGHQVQPPAECWPKGARLALDGAIAALLRPAHLAAAPRPRPMVNGQGHAGVLRGRRRAPRRLHRSRPRRHFAHATGYFRLTLASLKHCNHRGSTGRAAAARSSPPASLPSITHPWSISCSLSNRFAFASKGGRYGSAAARVRSPDRSLPPGVRARVRRHRLRPVVRR